MRLQRRQRFAVSASALDDALSQNSTTTNDHVITLRVSPRVHNRLQQLASAESNSVACVLRRLIAASLNGGGDSGRSLPANLETRG